MPPHRMRLAEVPRPTRPRHVRRPSGDGGPNQTIDRVKCSICGFSGNAITVNPGQNFPTAFVTTGSTYVWTSPSDPVTSLDKQVLPVPQPSVSCAFCGGSMLLGGSKGMGQ